MQIMFLVMRPLPGCSQNCQDCQYCQDFLQKGKTLFLEMKAEYFTEDLEVCIFYFCISLTVNLSSVYMYLHVVYMN